MEQNRAKEKRKRSTSSLARRLVLLVVFQLGFFRSFPISALESKFSLEELTATATARQNGQPILGYSYNELLDSS